MPGMFSKLVDQRKKKVEKGMITTAVKIFFWFSNKCMGGSKFSELKTILVAIEIFP